MNIQEFSVGPKFVLGQGSIKELSKLSIARAYIICDPFVEKSNMIHRILDCLKEMRALSKVFSRIVPDPTIEVISESIAEIREFKPDTVLAVGGGSAMDAAKAVVRVYTESERVAKPILVAIPTTSGSGSENTTFAVISDPKRNEKYALVDHSLVPDIAILDSVFTMSVPPAITADTGMDVLTHCLEAYVSKHATDFSDACAEKAATLTFRYIVEAYKKGDNPFAREKMHNASSIAGIAFNNAGLGICHSLSHAIGAFFHVPHGRINAVLLPHIISFNASLEAERETAVARRYAQMANVLNIYGITAKQCVRALNYAIISLMQQMEMPMTIKDLGIDPVEFEKMIPEMARRAIIDACTPTNPRAVTVAEIEEIYRGIARAESV
ncbi:MULTISPECIES: 1-propanol dehydrogenase PduQ [unclassified Streptococcus]|uniref:1-propanol dehydrogenase PduQ n=1 Tax=unclassified Streptococcus TaxID=2608887 RepID=UPI0010728ED7|nr:MULTISPECIES: 1-propanol dehydrogenase PduQ [unclassified Streptococcus]MBF0786418.1 iron-containing alcohol dehydrogenase [Streptococcus sp. 19428wC2_LYSM12]MCQ9212525.1 iron-containing alcohol dehydrogenase [Streptococcus sp. B01]MCQ9213864.1 iron-containing alcohol dehydrogenase [Streptococcus sp. O1]TFV06826.1 iron-containing alcohol dehydrogenase [Streptococcus sp. LYSM12]